MSRTYCRRGQRHEYRWVLRDWIWNDRRLLVVTGQKAAASSAY
jgi:hypothetical protein